MRPVLTTASVSGGPLIPVDMLQSAVRRPGPR